MTDEKIKRINELAKKAKTNKLSEEEVAEQKSLRAEYIESVKRNLRTQLDNVEFVDDITQ